MDANTGSPTWHQGNILCCGKRNAHALAFPAKKKPKDTVKDLIQPPPEYTSLLVQTKSKEFQIAQVKIMVEDLGTGTSFYFRICSSMIGSDAIALRTYHEVEGPYCDYIRHQIV